ncbi:MAG: hypothetical protein VYC17_01520 [Nitrospinota bacterium]|nr:hypothetical protein [Nitrospinota bacterium]
MKINTIFRLTSWFTLILALTIPSSLSAEPSPEKIRDIKKLLRVSGIYDQLSYLKDGLTKSIASAIRFTYPKIPEAFWTDLKNIVGEQEMENLVAHVIPVYDKHMDHQSLKKLIAMLENPFWAEWKKKMPQISREAGKIGSDWSQEMMVSKKFQAKVDSLINKHKLEQLNKPEKDQKPDATIKPNH